MVAPFDLDNQIDNLLSELRRFAKAIDRGPGGRETALAITKVQEAEYWFRDACRLINAATAKQD